VKLLTGVSGSSELHMTGASGVQKEPATQSPVIQSETTVDQSESSVDVTAQSSTEQSTDASHSLPTMTPVGKTQKKPNKIVCVTPEEVRPFPKAGARKTSSAASSRRRGDTQILTDTPVKRKIEEKAAAYAKKTKKEKAHNVTKVVQKKEVQKKVSSMCTATSKKKLQFAKEKHDKVKNDASCSEKCNVCFVTYGDKADVRSADDWLKCSGCQLWFHESCAQANGVLDDDDTYICIQCVD